MKETNRSDDFIRAKISQITKRRGMHAWTSKTLLLILLGIVASVEPVPCGAVRPAQNAAINSHESGHSAAFDVATIKPSDPLNSQEHMSMSPGGMFNATVTLKNLIERAYGIRDYQLADAPKWIASARYDIVAKSDEMDDPGKMTPAQQDDFIEREKQRLQSLLADRFNLKYHRVTKDLPVYALVLARSEPRLQPAKAGEAHRLYTQSPGKLTCVGASMPEFAAELPDAGVSRMVIDRTGLSGRYDFWLRWTPIEGLAPGASEVDLSGGSIFTALQEQLGLKLEPRKGPVDVLVLDHIDRPSEN